MIDLKKRATNAIEIPTPAAGRGLLFLNDAYGLSIKRDDGTIASIQGGTGTQGIQGIQGVKGDKGDTGAAGNGGSAGSGLLGSYITAQRSSLNGYTNIISAQSIDVVSKTINIKAAVFGQMLAGQSGQWEISAAGHVFVWPSGIVPDYASGAFIDATISIAEVGLGDGFAMRTYGVDPYGHSFVGGVPAITYASPASAGVVQLRFKGNTNNLRTRTATIAILNPQA